MNKTTCLNQTDMSTFFSHLSTKHKEETGELSFLFVKKLEEILHKPPQSEADFNLPQLFFLHWVENDQHLSFEAFVKEHFQKKLSSLHYEIDFIQHTASVSFEFYDEDSITRSHLMDVPLTKGRVEFLFSVYSCYLIFLGALPFFGGCEVEIASDFLFVNHIVDHVIDNIFM